jgi:hypothetical protein
VDISRVLGEKGNEWREAGHLGCCMVTVLCTVWKCPHSGRNRAWADRGPAVLREPVRRLQRAFLVKLL